MSTFLYKLCPNLKHVLFEVLLLFLAITEPFQNQLTEVREVYETFPENTRPVSLSSVSVTLSAYLAILFGISTTSCSVGFSPNIFMAGCKSFNNT